MLMSPTINIAIVQCIAPPILLNGSLRNSQSAMNPSEIVFTTIATINYQGKETLSLTQPSWL
jgi:hypothetical protein